MKKIFILLMFITISITSVYAGAGGDAWRATKKASSEVKEFFK